MTTRYSGLRKTLAKKKKHSDYFGFDVRLSDALAAVVVFGVDVLMIAYRSVDSSHSPEYNQFTAFRENARVVIFMSPAASLKQQPNGINEN